MSDLVLYGWPVTALGIMGGMGLWLWFESRRIDRLNAREAAEAARLRGDPAPRLK